MSAPLRVVLAETPAERALCMALRIEVFVVEQGVPLSIERDAHEDEALHFLAWQEAEMVATARVVLRAGGATAKIGRVAVRRPARGGGVGEGLMRAVEAHPVVARAGRLVLEAQTQALGFYARLGYAAVGEVFLEAGIRHQSNGKAAGPAKWDAAWAGAGQVDLDTAAENGSPEYMRDY